jgi:hypothetical protein
MQHYVYKIIDTKTNEFYIGSRTHIEPQNDSYMGSYYTWNPEDKSRLIKEIIKVGFKSREDAIEYEANLIEEYIDNKLNRNYHIPHKGFHVTGIPKSDEHRRKLSESKKELYKNNPELIEENKIIQKRRWDELLRAEWSRKMAKINSSPSYRKKQINSASDRAKTVVQYHINGDEINKYQSINEASRVTNIDKTCISRNCNGKYKSAGGFVWKFAT